MHKLLSQKSMNQGLEGKSYQLNLRQSQILDDKDGPNETTEGTLNDETLPNNERSGSRIEQYGSMSPKCQQIKLQPKNENQQQKRKHEIALKIREKANKSRSKTYTRNSQSNNSNISPSMYHNRDMTEIVNQYDEEPNNEQIIKPVQTADPEH